MPLRCVPRPPGTPSRRFTHHENENAPLFELLSRTGLPPRPHLGTPLFLMSMFTTSPKQLLWKLPCHIYTAEKSETGGKKPAEALVEAGLNLRGLVFKTLPMEDGITNRNFKKTPSGVLNGYYNWLVIRGSMGWQIYVRTRGNITYGGVAM